MACWHRSKRSGWTWSRSASSHGTGNHQNQATAAHLDGHYRRARPFARPPRTLPPQRSCEPALGRSTSADARTLAELTQPGRPVLIKDAIIPSQDPALGDDAVGDTLIRDGRIAQVGEDLARQADGRQVRWHLRHRAGCSGLRHHNDCRQLPQLADSRALQRRRRGADRGPGRSAQALSPARVAAQSRTMAKAGRNQHMHGRPRKIGSAVLRPRITMIR